jgi:predicted amidohydrolase
MRKIKVAGIQILTDAKKAEMLEKAEKYIKEACEAYHGLDIIILPELFYQSPFLPFPGEEFGEEPNGMFEDFMKSMAKKYQVNIIAGSYAIKSGGKASNTTLVIDRSGGLVGEYSKVHLFDSLGARESDVIKPGDGPGIFDLDCGKIGVVICYDLRFPEFTRSMAMEGIDALFAPSAFFTPRHDHWEILVKSTAVQNVMHVVAVNQIGEIPEKLMGYFGRSMMVDPWGVIIAGASDREGYFYGELDLEYRDQVRKQLPCLDHRRTDIYK